MAITSLLGTNLRWNPKFQSLPVQFVPHKPEKVAAGSIKPAHFPVPAKLSVNCVMRKSESSSPESLVEKQENPSTPFQEIVDRIVKTLKALRKPATLVVLVGLLLYCDPNSALAASGGRMGGRSFSSSSSSSSRSYSTRTVGPSISYSVPYYAPSPFWFGGGFGSPVAGIGSIVMALFAFTFVWGLISDRSEGGVLTATEKTSVLKLQVGLLGIARSLQRDLNQIAETADTSTPEGLSYVLTESTLALLRHPQYCISGYSSVDVKQSLEGGEKCFNQLSIEERGKFDEETFVNINNIRKHSAASQRSNGFSNEYIVVTILVAAEGVHKLPTINGSGDLEKALRALGSIPSRRIMAVEVLWTPQSEDGTLSERELLEDYPVLRPL